MTYVDAIKAGYKFQSTPPARGATTNFILVPGDRIFQSTPPARGATRVLRPDKANQNISIHAPREGGDLLAFR